MQVPLRAAGVLKNGAHGIFDFNGVQRRRADTAAAVQAFEKYLVLAPDAPDAPMIKRYVSEMKQ